MRTTLDDYLSPRHRTLQRIATAAKVLAYVAFVFFALQAGLVLLSQLNLERLYPYSLVAGEKATWYLNLALSALNSLLNAVVFWVLLSGLSVGLRMVVETDVNYRLGAEEAGDE